MQGEHSLPPALEMLKRGESCRPPGRLLASASPSRMGSAGTAGVVEHRTHASIPPLSLPAQLPDAREGCRNCLRVAARHNGGTEQCWQKDGRAAASRAGDMGGSQERCPPAYPVGKVRGGLKGWRSPSITACSEAVKE